MADYQQILDDVKQKMERTVQHLEEQLIGVRAGRANPNILTNVLVPYYGNDVPVSQVASVNIPDSRTILIQPWEKGIIGAIEKAILDANIGLTPSNNGEQIRLTIPSLTEERRKELVKQIGSFAEAARVSLRNSRRDGVDGFRKCQKDGMPEDRAKTGENDVQKLIDKFDGKVDELIKSKEDEIMTV